MKALDRAPAKKLDILIHAIHNGDESMIIDNRKRLGYQLRMFTARCFPPKPSNKAKPLTAGCSPPRPSGSSEPDYGNLHSESASQILQSFIGASGSSQISVPKEEPDMDHDEILQSFIGASGSNQISVPKEEPDMDHDEVGLLYISLFHAIPP
ncbi:unnamed protein product [Strongylus vulgaris]|uniref:Uncharacterized protein n=1 Tax=Strongylus vulgaris TaxID=40348 RepID=A0A3P7LQA0_STRVU|nr:unnamed protein product [Strongylus vulgaris]